MSVYSNREILAAIEEGTIVCTPFDPDNVSEASLDFTLGHYFYKQEFDDQSSVYNPFDEAEVARYFKGPLMAIPHAEWCEHNGFRRFRNIPDEHPIIVLRPGERILAHTHEFVGIRAQSDYARDLQFKQARKRGATSRRAHRTINFSPDRAGGWRLRRRARRH